MPSGCKKRARKSASEHRKQLRAAVIKGDVQAASDLLEKHSALRDNSHWENGRTALHLALQYAHYSFAMALIRFGFSLCAKDDAGFTPFDLLVNPLDFTCKAPSLQDRRLRLVREASHLFQEKFSLVYVGDVDQLDQFIERHPCSDRVGFIVDLPNILKGRTDDVGVVPIFFQRLSSSHERFTILGSVPKGTPKRTVKDIARCRWRDDSCKSVVFMPLKIKQGIEREIFYCPSFRKASGGIDCFTDAVLDLVSCHTSGKLPRIHERASDPVILWGPGVTVQTSGASHYQPHSDDMLLRGAMFILLSRACTVACEAAAGGSFAEASLVLRVFQASQGDKRGLPDYSILIRNMMPIIEPDMSLFVATARRMETMRQKIVTADQLVSEHARLIAIVRSMDREPEYSVSVAAGSGVTSEPQQFRFLPSQSKAVPSSSLETPSAPEGPRPSC